MRKSAPGQRPAQCASSMPSSTPISPTCSGHLVQQYPSTRTAACAPSRASRTAAGTRLLHRVSNYAGRGIRWVVAWCRTHVTGGASAAGFCSVHGAVVRRSAAAIAALSPPGGRLALLAAADLGRRARSICVLPAAPIPLRRRGEALRVFSGPFRTRTRALGGRQRRSTRSVSRAERSARSTCRSRTSLPSFRRELVLDESLSLFYWHGEHLLAANVLSVLVVVVAAPFVEEVMFRGMLLPSWSQRRGRTRGILFSSLVFALVHLDPIGVFVFAVVMALAFCAPAALGSPCCHGGNNRSAACGSSPTGAAAATPPASSLSRTVVGGPSFVGGLRAAARVDVGSGPL